MSSMHKKLIKKAGAGLAIASALALIPQAQAANWLALYNANPPVVTPPIKIWGFVQPGYSATDGKKVEGLQGPASVTTFTAPSPTSTASART